MIRFSFLCPCTLIAPKQLALDLLDAPADALVQREELVGVAHDGLHLGDGEGREERQRLEVHLRFGREREAHKSAKEMKGSAKSGQALWLRGKTQPRSGASAERGRWRRASCRGLRGVWGGWKMEWTRGAHLDQDAQVLQVASLRLDELDKRVVPLLVELGGIGPLLGLGRRRRRVVDEELGVVLEWLVGPGRGGGGEPEGSGGEGKRDSRVGGRGRGSRGRRRKVGRRFADGGGRKDGEVGCRGRGRGAVDERWGRRSGRNVVVAWSVSRPGSGGRERGGRGLEGKRRRQWAASGDDGEDGRGRGGVRGTRLLLRRTTRIRLQTRVRPSSASCFPEVLC